MRNPGPMSFNACAWSVAVEERQHGDAASIDLALEYERWLGWDAAELALAALSPLPTIQHQGDEP